MQLDIVHEKFLAVFALIILEAYVRYFINSFETKLINIALALMVLGSMILVDQYTYATKNKIMYYIYALIAVSLIFGIMQYLNIMQESIYIKKELILLGIDTLLAFFIAHLFKDPSKFCFITFLLTLLLAFKFGTIAFIIGIVLAYIEQHFIS